MTEQLRKIQRIVTGRQTIDGAGVSLVRVFGYHDTEDFDPFLMLDAFDSSNPEEYIKGFPWHPHRGIETITYLIEGDVEHGDSLGNRGSILDGECQWMTAGSGIIHQEMPQPTSRLLGCQLWLNLPAKDKMVTPAYNDIIRDSVPEIREQGAHIRVIAGRYGDKEGAFQGQYVPLQYLDVQLQAGVKWETETDDLATVFVYILQGQLAFAPEGDYVPQKSAVLLSRGSRVHLQTGESGARLLMLAGRPLREPVAWGGSIVMNTEQELKEAYADLERDNFIRHKAILD